MLLKKDFKNLKDGIEYVTRYCGRAPTSENRILNYDGKNVTFCYNAHEDNKYHKVTITAEEFIKILLNHISLKLLDIAVFIEKKHILHGKMFMLVSSKQKSIRKSFLKYELSILRSFKRNPYNCPKCDVRMNYIVRLI